MGYPAELRPQTLETLGVPVHMHADQFYRDRKASFAHFEQLIKERRHGIRRKPPEHAAIDPVHHDVRRYGACL